MKHFPPYPISHIDLQQALALLPPDVNGKGAYLVFWWKDVALGQLFVEPDKALTAEEYLQQIILAIRPAIQFYAAALQLPGCDWEQLMQRHLLQKWTDWMDQLFYKFTPNAIPEKVPVSVVICTRDRPIFIRLCLEKLSQLRCVPEEIVVVDNAPSTNATEEIVRNFPGVKYVKAVQPGLDIARNAGINHARFSIIAFVDDDVLVHPLYVYRVWETFLDPSIAAMTGLVIASSLETEAQLIFEKYWSFNKGYTDIYFDHQFLEKTLLQGPPVWEVGAGANMAFRKSAFTDTGLFHELLDAGAAGCSGDSEMWFRFLLKGHRIHYNPRAIVHHEHRRDLKDLQKQIFYYMRGYTAAAFCQQHQLPASGYRSNILRNFPKNYLRSIIKQFPRYPFQFKTLGAEIKGIFSGLLFYQKKKAGFQKDSL